LLARRVLLAADPLTVTFAYAFFRRTRVGDVVRDRRTFDVTGLVQGVGFRPYVHALATQLQLAGHVRNDAGRVHIEVEGPADAVTEFSRRLAHEAPPLARIDGVVEREAHVTGQKQFLIQRSTDDGVGDVAFGADLAPCQACLAEVLDPADRRYGYPFSSCTRCGPRLTIVARAPYDRANTTLARFPLCAACRSEYEDPSDRRFHAEPIACPACGPKLSMPLAKAAVALCEGKIVALKGVGGFHLACDALDDAAVARLRQRKERDQKPFAIMVGSLDLARTLCVVSAEDAERLQSPERPIVVLEARRPCGVAASVAPSLHTLGVMLPSTLLHELLLREVDGGPLVMTSGNRSDEPIVTDDAVARVRLAGIADVFLGHDRPIHVRCDDSVVRAGTVLRRSRGYAPLPFVLPTALRVPTLAVGGMLKSTLALGEGRRAVVSHHLGDLQHHAAFEAFTRAVVHYQQLFRVQPERVIADLHPDYPSSVWARELGLPVLRVQHHVAHVASCLAEHQVTGRVAAVAFDGAGYGLDGSVWGGEFFVGELASLTRVAWLSAVPLPGGDTAAHEGWRMALVRLREAGLPTDVVAARVGAAAVHTVEQMIERGINAPLTSSAGRLFDAAAWLVGIDSTQTFEGQAAMHLEALAARAPESGHYPVDGCDVRPLIRGLVEDRAEPAVRARRFHSSLAHLIASVCRTLDCADVVLTGGVFQNALLAHETDALLRAQGMRPLRHHEVPPNDAGLCVGQLAVAAALDERRL
jgi:hydrogenase maturation protein HypF